MLDPTGRLVLTAAPYDGAVAAELVAELQLEYVRRYGGPDTTPTSPSEFAPPDGVYLVASVDGEVVGSLALRRHGGTTVELKRMFVREAHRRRGLARRMLAAAEETARSLGYDRIVLETGTEQPEAMALYDTAGYHPIPNFGHFATSSRSRCFGRDLV